MAGRALNLETGNEIGTGTKKATNDRQRITIITRWCVKEKESDWYRDSEGRGGASISLGNGRASASTVRAVRSISD